MRKSTSLILFLVLLIITITSCATTAKGYLTEANKQKDILVNLETGWDSLWRDDYTSARISFQTVLELDPTSAEAMRGIGLSYLALGDYYGGADHLLKALSIEPESPYSVPIRDFLQSEFPPSLSLYKKIAKANQSLSNKRLPLWMQREGLLGYHSVFQNPEPKAEAFLSTSERLGIVRGWKILGPFTNTSGAGIDRNFIDETSRDPFEDSHTYSGVEGMSISWFKPETESLTGEIFINGYTGSRYSTGYAETTVSIKKPGDYCLIFTQYGALKCWIDGELVLSDPVYRYAADVHWVNRNLEAGDHKILIKASNQNSRAGFSLSLVKIVSNNLPEHASNFYLDLFPDSNLLGSDPLLQVLSSQIDTEQPRLEDLFWLSYMLSVKQYNSEALAVIDKGREVISSKENAFFDLLEMNIYNRMGKTRDAFSSALRSYHRGIYFAPSIVFLMQKHTEQNRWKDLENLIEKSEELFGSWFYGTAFRAVKKAILQGEAAAKEEIDIFVKAYPDSPFIDYQILDNPNIEVTSSFSELIDRITKKGRPIDASLRKMRNYIYKKDYTKAFETAKYLTSLLPEREEVWVAYLKGGLYSNSLSLDNSLPILDKCLRTFPYSSEILNLDIFRSEVMISYLEDTSRSSSVSDRQGKLQKEKDRLKETLKRYLILNPSDISSRERLFELEGKGYLSSYIEEINLFSFIEHFKEEVFNYDTDLIIVLDSDHNIYFEDGGVFLFRQDIIKIQSQKGVELMNPFFLDFNPNLTDVYIKTACVLKPDGTHTEGYRSGRRITFPGLSPGDYIVLGYYCSSSRAGELKKHFWEHVPLNEAFPIFYKKHVLGYPQIYNLSSNFHNTETMNMKKSIDALGTDMLKHTLTVMHTEPTKIGRWIPGWQDHYAWADFTSLENWDPVTDWYREIYEGQCTVTPNIQKKTDSLISGAESRDEIISRIFSFVAGQIIYEDLTFQYDAIIPQSAESVLEDGYGDCKDKSILLISMLKAAGIDSYIALSLPEYQGEKTFLPSPRFSHTFVVLDNNGTELILDPTTGIFSYPEFPPEMIGSWYLPIPPEGNSQEKVIKRIGPSLDGNSTVLVYNLEVDEKEFKLQAAAVYGGYPAAIIRSAQGSSDSSYNKDIFGLIISKEIPGFIIEEYSARHIQDLSTAPVIEYSGRFPSGMVQISGDLWSLDLPWNVSLPPNILGINSLEQRASGLHIFYQELALPKKQIIAVSIPPGYTSFNLPETKIFRYRTARAVFRYSIKNGRIMCEREFCIPPMNIPPEEIDNFKQFLFEIFQKEREPILIRKGTRLSLSDTGRDQ